MDNISYINFIEIYLFILSSIFLFFIALKKIKSVKKSLILLLILVPALYLSIEGTTQFLTTDETTIMKEVVDIEKSDLSIFYGQSNRTTDLLIGVPLNWFQKYDRFHFNTDQLKIIAKTMHWMIGFILIILIYELISKYCITKEQQLYYFIIYFYSILLLPVNILALKICNYDLLSMLFGILGIILSLIAIKNENEKTSLFSIIVSVLATQEKLIAAPVLLFALFTYVYIKLIKCKTQIYLKSVLYSFYSMSIAFLTSLATFIIIAMCARHGLIPKIDFFNVSFPLILYLVPIMRVISGNYIVYSAIFSLFGTWMLLSVGIIALMMMKSWIIKSFFPFFQKYIKLISLITVLVIFISGIIGTYFIKSFWHPFVPIEVGNYFPPYWINSTVWHFGVKTVLQHFLSYFFFAYAVFINAIPSIYFCILGFLFFIWFKKKKKDYFYLEAWEIIFLIILAIPMSYAITNTPVSHRYFNMFIYILIVIIGLKLTKCLEILNKSNRKNFITLFVILLIIETLPFRPVFSAFRPIWSNYPKKYNNTPIIGQSNPWWLGWGEEIFIAGKKILQLENLGQSVKLNDIHIYYAYNGSWMNFNDSIKIFPIWKEDFSGYDYTKLRFTESDYYIINRTSILCKGGFYFEKIKPSFTLSYRGFIQAWIYRGDQLKNINKLKVLNTGDKYYDK